MDQFEKNLQHSVRSGKGALRGSFAFWLFLVLFAVAADQALKFLAFGTDFGSCLEAFRPVAGKELYKNYQFAFSLPVPPAFMYLIYFSALAFMAYYLAKNFSRLGRLQKLAWSLILAGALSNVAERALLGYVRDFIYVLSGILNFADLLIIGGIIILLFGQFEPRFAKSN